MGHVKLLLLSDPHFFVKDDASVQHHSHLPLAKDGTWHRIAVGSRKNPLTDLIDLLSTEGLTSDLVLCAGDITTRANGTALKTGWRSLIDLGHCVKASLVASATGNHDIASRSSAGDVARDPLAGLSASKSPIEELKQLRPTYPVVWMDHPSPQGRREIQGRYFGEYFVLLDEHEDYRLLIVNSCCEHGHDNHEYGRGTFPDSALQWLKEDVAKLNREKINLLLLHHPPQSDAQDGVAYDFCRGADLLLHELQAGLAGTWVVLHGHKHDPKLRHGPSATGVAPVILSAGSFAAADDMPMDAKNQVYRITVHLDGGQVMGTIDAWHWSLGNGWQRSAPRDCGGIHDGCGFGTRMSPAEIATALSDAYSAGCRTWDDIRGRIPHLPYIMPKAMDQAMRLLRDRHQLVVDFDNWGFYQSIVRSM